MVEILTACIVTRANMHLRFTFHADQSNRFRDGHFSIFEDIGHPPSWIFKSLTF